MKGQFDWQRMAKNTKHAIFVLFHRVANYFWLVYNVPGGPKTEQSILLGLCSD